MWGDSETPEWKKNSREAAAYQRAQNCAMALGMSIEEFRTWTNSSHEAHDEACKRLLEMGINPGTGKYMTAGPRHPR